MGVCNMNVISVLLLIGSDGSRLLADWSRVSSKFWVRMHDLHLSCSRPIPRSTVPLEARRDKPRCN